MILVFLRKISKIFAFWNRTRKELLIIAALIVLVFHYAFLNDSLNFGPAERVLNELPYVHKPLPIGPITCVIPKLDPFAKSVTQYEPPPVDITCGGEDWVRCYNSKCNQTDEILEKILNSTCEFQDIFPRNGSDILTLGPISLIRSNESYSLKHSDYVKVLCQGINVTNGRHEKWSGTAMALRPVSSPPARKDSINVLVLAFDTLSANAFQRLMPNSWIVLKETLRATVMKGYSTIGGGMASALLPILTGKTEYELFDAKKDDPHSLDEVQFLYQTLKERGYRTAFFEDMPSKGILEHLGFKDHPADHHFHKSILEYGAEFQRYCLGDTPEVKLILNITKQFMDLDGNRFGFTYISDIMNNNFSMVQSADDVVEKLLLDFQRHKENTLLVVVSDHGLRWDIPNRYSPLRESWQGQLEERLPLLALALPRKLMLKRHRAALALAANANAVTTPYDLHATLADVLGMNGTGKRGLSLFEMVPKNRSCSDASVEPHWCFCLHWEHVAKTHPMFRRTAFALIQFINSLLKEVRFKCATRNLTNIEWVMREIPASGGLSPSIYPGLGQENNPNYQIRVALRPDDAVFETTMLHIEREDRFIIKARHISRTNYGDYVPLCIAETHPHLAPICRCEY